MRLLVCILLVISASVEGCSLGPNPELVNVLEYNARFNDGKTKRWVQDVVKIHDGTGVISEDEFALILDELNTLDGPEFVRGGPGSEIEIKMVKELPLDENGKEPLAETEIKPTESVEIHTAEIRVSFNRYWFYDRRLFKHELVHARGFIGHTDDRGLMDKKPISEKITPLVVFTVRALYNLPPGTKLN